MNDFLLVLDDRLLVSHDLVLITEQHLEPILISQDLLLVRDYGAAALINMSNIEWVYNKDPKKHSDAIFIEKLKWNEYEQMINQKWSPGTNIPFDPVATTLAKSLNCTVYIIGKNLDNLDKLLTGDTFKGTVISSA